ncbi:MAG TPA: bifunctional riboflavin kinase/FAD synthetase [Vicinamibacteria bacterium]|nr:bifunctional riboflavin kinase/FAD synthetase [Vicinamibacteria bacterium]
MDRVRIERLSPLGWPVPAVTVGNFDGVHLGHQALVASAVRQARAGGGVSVVLTFDPHPARVVRPGHAPAPLTTLDQKAELLGGLGVDRLAVLPFDAAVAGLGPEAFAREVLVETLGARHVVVGESFRFGRGREGDALGLRALGGRLGFEVDAIPPVVAAGEPVSSSRVRRALARGDVREARLLLGRPYFVDAIVVRGDGRGRRIGVPTANLAPENEMAPARGVYAARCRVPDGRWAGAVVNLGHRPTFGGGPVTVEAHLLDFEGDLYGARVRLEFHGRVRGEQRFDGAEALVARIHQDVAEARALLSASADERI